MRVMCYVIWVMLSWELMVASIGHHLMRETYSDIWPSFESIKKSLVGDDFGVNESKWSNGALATDGVIYCIPESANQVLSIDPIGEFLCWKIRRNLEHSLDNEGKWRFRWVFRWRVFKWRFCTIQGFGPLFQTIKDDCVLSLRSSSLDKTKCLRYWRKLWNQSMVIVKTPISAHSWSRYLTKRAPCVQLIICFAAIFLGWIVQSAAWNKATRRRKKN